MGIRGNLVYLSAGLVGTALWMLSCASSAHPEELKVKAPEHYTGVIHVDTCVNGAPANEVTLDADGRAKTAMCPGADRRVEITVEEGTYEKKLGTEEVKIHRTGDGIATSVEGEVK